MPRNDMSDIGAAVRWAREQCGITRAALAEASGVGLRTLQRLEDGEGCHLAHLLAVGHALGLEVLFREPTLVERVHSAIARAYGLTWLLDRPSLSASEAEQLAQLLDEQLAQRRADGSRLWQGTAADYWSTLRVKLRRMAPPRRTHR